jgi:hypothetical protein
VPFAPPIRVALRRRDRSESIEDAFAITPCSARVSTPQFGTFILRRLLNDISASTTIASPRLPPRPAPPGSAAVVVAPGEAVVAAVVVIAPVVVVVVLASLAVLSAFSARRLPPVISRMTVWWIRGSTIQSCRTPSRR